MSTIILMDFLSYTILLQQRIYREFKVTLQEKPENKIEENDPWDSSIESIDA